MAKLTKNLRVIIFFLLTFFACVGLPLLAQNPIQSPELRGVWLTNVDSDVLLTTRNLQRSIDRLQRLNFNTIYPVVYNRGYTMFRSRTMEKYTGTRLYPRLRGRDILTEAIRMGHSQNMAVTAWFEYGLMAPENSDLVRRHPNWVTRRRDGTSTTDFGNMRLVRLNPAHPEVQDFLVELVREVARRYPVDGIQFDDHFGWPVDMGYDEFTINLYQQQHGGALPPEDPRDPEWMRWRANFVTNLWGKIFTSVRLFRPSAIVSLAPNPALFSYTSFLQDWVQWARWGQIDELIVQVYRDNMPAFLSELSAPELQELRTKIPVAIGILTGLRVRPISIELISEQVQALRILGFHGFSYFFYGSLGDRDLQFQTLKSGPVTRPTRQSIAVQR